MAGHATHETTILREARRVLRALGRAKLERRGDDFAAALRAGGKPKLTAKTEIVLAFLARGWIAPDPDGRLGLTADGEAFMKRASETTQAGFRAQHGEVERSPGGLRVDHAPSPIDFLKRFTLPDGTPFLSPEECAAAERLEADFERAQWRPRMTGDLSTPIDRGGRMPGRAEHAGAAAVDARRRCMDALAAAGPGLSDLLFETVCMARGLNEAERGFGWPARAGKTILKLALGRLADHYGLASGTRRPGRIETWIAESGAA